jgi:hypothetical protein
MVVLLRSIGVPARIVNGFQNGEFNEVGEDYIIRGSDAHSWVEAFFPGKGWQPFDPTPPSSEKPSSSFLFKTVFGYWDALELFWGQWILPYDDVIQASLFTNLQQWTSRWNLEGRDLVQNRTQQFYLLLANGASASGAWLKRRGWWLPVLVLSGGCLCWMSMALFQRLRWQWFLMRIARSGSFSAATGLYQEMLRVLRQKGKIKPPAQTPNEFAHSLLESPLHEPVSVFTALYNQIRFSGVVVQPQQARQAYHILTSLKQMRRPK